ncbi:hypothetical protein JTB14_025258 [Gonioctena quinquepunctata]|nr:hypothetical protein JTB14_025258 [Gonioctena quinquepunctata]
MNNFNEKLSNPEEDDASMYNNAHQGETQEIDEDRQNLPQRKTRIQSTETDTADEGIPNRHDLPQGSKSNHSETDTADKGGSNQTVHTNHENPKFEIPVSEKPINVYKNLVLLKFVNYNPSIPVIEHTFLNKQRIHAQIGLDDVEKSLFNFFKEYISPKSKYALLFLPEKNNQPTCDLLRRTFRNTAWTLAMGQEIKIPDLKENSGILLLKLGAAQIRTNTHDFIHYYNLTPITQEIDAIQNQYKAVAMAINNGLSRPYWTNLLNFIQGSNTNLKQFIENSNQYIHHIEEKEH